MIALDSIKPPVDINSEVLLLAPPCPKTRRHPPKPFPPTPSVIHLPAPSATFEQRFADNLAFTPYALHRMENYHPKQMRYFSPRAIQDEMFPKPPIITDVQAWLHQPPTWMPPEKVKSLALLFLKRSGLAFVRMEREYAVLEFLTPELGLSNARLYPQLEQMTGYKVRVDNDRYLIHLQRWLSTLCRSMSLKHLRLVEIDPVEKAIILHFTEYERKPSHLYNLMTTINQETLWTVKPYLKDQALLLDYMAATKAFSGGNYRLPVVVRQNSGHKPSVDEPLQQR